MNLLFFYNAIAKKLDGDSEPLALAFFQLKIIPYLLFLVKKNSTSFPFFSSSFFCSFLLLFFLCNFVLLMDSHCNISPFFSTYHNILTYKITLSNLYNGNMHEVLFHLPAFGEPALPMHQIFVLLVKIYEILS